MIDRFRNLILVIAAVLAAGNLGAQKNTLTDEPNPSIAVSLSLAKQKLAPGEQVWSALTVTNLSDTVLSITEPRPIIEGEKGILMLRPYAQAETLPWIGPGFILPDDYFTQRWQLDWLYDLSAPGKYKVYFEVRDPLFGKTVRSNTEEFEIQRTTN